MSRTLAATSVLAALHLRSSIRGSLIPSLLAVGALLLGVAWTQGDLSEALKGGATLARRGGALWVALALPLEGAEACWQRRQDGLWIALPSPHRMMGTSLALSLTLRGVGTLIPFLLPTLWAAALGIPLDGQTLGILTLPLLSALGVVSFAIPLSSFWAGWAGGSLASLLALTLLWWGGIG